MKPMFINAGPAAQTVDQHWIDFLKVIQKDNIFQRITTNRARISKPVPGEQCHPIHLTILRRFSSLSLAPYLCTKVA